MHDFIPQSTLAHREAVAAPTERSLDFLWLELTNRCNLQCVHCYTESSPFSGDNDRLSKADYSSVMQQAYALGCRKLQFIGGEPQLNPDFHALLVEAKEIGFQFIEVFSNLTKLDEETLNFAAGNGVCFATSVYSDKPAGHDAITKVRSSHQRTIGNLRRLIDAGVTTRAAIIAIDQDQPALIRTMEYLVGLGVSHVRSGETREFGRGQALLSRPAQMSGLCGHCWSGKLCVAPDGQAFPCVMARHWPVGNVLDQPLAKIVSGDSLQNVRQAIFDGVWRPKLEASKKPAKPKKYPGKTNSKPIPADPNPVITCPQLCGPDLSSCTPMSCEPATCPQTCTPPIIDCVPTVPQ
jgi:MoaA/NifB/PqqE/SkfB family radical SAM enzyme